MEVDLRHVCFEGKRPFEGRRAFSQSTRRNLRHPHVRPPTTEPADGFVDWIIRRAGLDAGRYRHRPLLRRLPACLRTLKVHSTEEARELLKNRPDLLPAAISSLLIGVTEFFRDPPVFESVRTTILSNAAGMRGPLRSLECSLLHRRRTVQLGHPLRRDAFAAAQLLAGHRLPARRHRAGPCGVLSLPGAAAVGTENPQQVLRGRRRFVAADSSPCGGMCIGRSPTWPKAPRRVPGTSFCGEMRRSI